MTFDGLTFGATLLGAGLIDALVRPRAGERPAMRTGMGLWLLACMSAALYGAFLAVCGNGGVAMVLALAVQALLAVASNAKHAMLGEPLLFSDLALVGAVFRHPQFYLSAVRLSHRIAAGIVAAVLLALVAWLSVADIASHMAGLALAIGALVTLAITLRLASPGRLVPDARAHADTRRFGLLAALLLFWLRWRESRDPPPCPALPRAAPPAPPELVVMIQCESFADPEELFANPALALRSLGNARAKAWRWGNLHVSGFGAYTMRTEYGVLFGRGEEELGFRRFDPFLTAVGEASYALPARLQAEGGPGWRSLFVHPHDMRFYGRDRIMPAGGFAELVGEDRFAPPGPGEGRYVTDAAMADEIIALAAAASGPTLLYAVTIENHGPWETQGGEDLVEGYMRLVRRSDAMLGDLLDRIAGLSRPALLVFFGDHRPSIPGATAPGGDRHTPYVMVRMDAAGRILPGDDARADLTPAQLHHAVLDAVLGTPLTPAG
ncbi:LTA synthase family protein [Novosphingobium silvae]